MANGIAPCTDCWQIFNFQDWRPRHCVPANAIFIVSCAYVEVTFDASSTWGETTHPAAVALSSWWR